jgi:hypothetical protein
MDRGPRRIDEPQRARRQPRSRPRSLSRGHYANTAVGISGLANATKINWFDSLNQTCTMATDYIYCLQQ